MKQYTVFAWTTGEGFFGRCGGMLDRLEPTFHSVKEAEEYLQNFAIFNNWQIVDTKTWNIVKEKYENITTKSS